MWEGNAIEDTRVILSRCGRGMSHLLQLTAGEMREEPQCVRIQPGHLSCDVSCHVFICHLGQLEEMGAV